MKANVLRYIRETLDLKQSELAALLGVTHITISRWETEIYRPCIEAQKRLKAVLNYTEEDLLQIEQLLREEQHSKLQEKIRKQANLS